MAELLARFGKRDVRLLERVLAPSAAHARPDRVVLDAHVAGSEPAVAELTRRGGVPLLVDPQTYYFQDVQYEAARWAQLPFADPAAHRPSDLLSPARQTELVAACIDWQLSCGATALIPPYMHVERHDDGWLEVQIGLWRRTRRYLDAQDLALPVVAVTAVGWRLLPRNRWGAGLDRLRDGLDDLEVDEIALAASKADQGAHPDQRLVDFVAAIDHLRRFAPVLAWRQGALGEAAVAGGAVGYETGIGWRERCDLRQAMGAHRRPAPVDAGFGARPVYIAALGRSIPKRSLEALLETRLSPHLLCDDYQCCSAGPRSLLADARAHGLATRARNLDALDQIAQHAWRWRRLADTTNDGLDLANRINRLADTHPRITKVDTHALRAVQVVANNRRQTLRRGRAA